ncbi:MAG: hypothetical protein PWQ35_503 [Patescibacteria group bacterium]|nr:hypothetical protein [Patescibacteria group bacterium]
MQISQRKLFWFLGLVILIIIIIANSRFIYHRLIRPNKEIFPQFITAIITAREQRLAPSPIVYKDEKTIKILEGWTVEDIGNYLVQFNFSKAEFKALVGEPKVDYRQRDTNPIDFSERFSFLADKPSYYGLEGFLFPDTYRVFTSATTEDVVIKMLENFEQKLRPELREEIARQGKSIYEIVIMASLIEKEAPINYSDPENTDARIVSDIFWGRLEAGQALESDATLSYWFADTNPVHSGEELSVDTPYNSYKYKGLPPTPICNPGIRAIEAAIYPLETDYNYFLTDLKGENIYYARTYQEHLNNKYKYLK